MFPAGEWGDGDRHVMFPVTEIVKNDCQPGLSFVYSPYVLGTLG
jgi:hypothetical protein